MTSIALSSKWCPESCSLHIDQVFDSSFKGYEPQPPTS